MKPKFNSFTRVLSFCASLAAISAAQAATPLAFTSSQWISSRPAIRWTDQGPGMVYTVQYQPSVDAGIWLMPRAYEPWPTQDTTWLDTYGGNEGQRFYRVLAWPYAQRGKIVSAQLAQTLSTAEISFLFSLAGVPLTAQYGVRIYKLNYETITPWGGPTTASGVLCLPVNPARAPSLVSYQHGTIMLKSDAPSAMSLTGELAVGVAFATTGYAAVLPDYLGLGDGPGFHPYHHARSEATVGIDLLRAARAYCAANAITLYPHLFLCGYSNGGHATLAMLREMETFYTAEFPVVACAPAAGAYDLSGTTTTDFLSDRVQPNPYYFAYFLAAYQYVYRFAPTLGDLLAPPYDTTLPPLLDGLHDDSAINAAMPSVPHRILKPAFVDAIIRNPDHPFRLALRENDLIEWTPRTRLRLYHCSGDQDVVFANSEVAYASFVSRGAAQVQLINPLPGGTHGTCVLPTLLSVKLWFDSLD